MCERAEFSLFRSAKFARLSPPMLLLENGRQPREYRTVRSAVNRGIHAFGQRLPAALIFAMVKKQNRDLRPDQLQGFGKCDPFCSDQLRVNNNGIAWVGNGNRDGVIGRERQQNLVSLPLDRFLQRAQSGEQWADAEHAFVWLLYVHDFLRSTMMAPGPSSGDLRNQVSGEVSIWWVSRESPCSSLALCPFQYK